MTAGTVTSANNRFFGRFQPAELETLRDTLAAAFYNHELLSEVQAAITATEMDPVDTAASGTLAAWGFTLGDRVRARVRNDSVMVDENDEGNVVGFRNGTDKLMVRFDGDSDPVAVDPEDVEAI